MPPTSERVITVQRPRFQVEGAAQPQLDSDLLWLEVRHDEHGIATLEARFNNMGQASEGEGSGYRWFDDRVLQLGRQVKVAAGDEDNEGLLFTGAITSIRGRFSPERGPEVLIRAEDAGFLLRLRPRTRVFEDKSDQDIVGQIAQEHGLTASGDTPGPTHTQLWQVNQSDLGLLRARARAVDARLSIADTTLKFEPRRGAATGEPIQLTAQRELLSFEATADLAHQRTEVQVHGWSVADKRGIHESAASSVVTAESGGGKTGPSVLEDLGWEAVEHHHLEAPVTTDEARTLAESMLKRRARRFVTAIGTTSGTPGLRVGGQIDVADVGPYFSGKYTVVALRHCFDQSLGLRSHFSAERTDLGGRG